MRTLLLTAAALLIGTPAQATILTMGSSYAESCYRAADARDTRRNAKEICDQALGTEGLSDYDRMGTHVNRGILWMVTGNLDRAVQDFDAALAIRPNEPEAWLNKGIAMIKAGNSRAALPMVEKAISLRTTRPEIAYYARAIANEDVGNLRAAYNDLKHATRLAPRWREPAVELARYQVRSR